MRTPGSTWWWLAVGLVWAHAASAQDARPTVAPAPLELSHSPEAISAEQQQQLLEDFDRLVRVTGVRVPMPSEMAGALSAMQRQDFSESDEALAQLALMAQTLYAVHVRIDYPDAGSVVAEGKVVRSDGTRMGEPVRLERSPEASTYLQATSEALAAVLEKLALQRLPTTMPPVAAPVKPAEVAQVPTQPVAPPPPPTPLVIRPEPFNQRLAGKVICVGGAAVMASGLVSLGLAASDARKLSPDERHYLPPEQTGLYGAAKAKETAGAILLGIGAATAMGGGALWLLAAPDVPVQLTIAPASDGATASLGGSF